jgi:hypothetical protein
MSLHTSDPRISGPDSSNDIGMRHARDAEPAAAAWRKMVGTALLWVALAVLVTIPASGETPSRVLLSLIGFVSFATGLALFADGFKRSIVAAIADRSSSHRA